MANIRRALQPSLQTVLQRDWRVGCWDASVVVHEEAWSAHGPQVEEQANVTLQAACCALPAASAAHGAAHRRRMASAAAAAAVACALAVEAQTTT